MTIHPLSKPSEAAIRADIIALLNTFPETFHLPDNASFSDIAALEPHLTQLAREQIYALNDVVPHEIPPLSDFVLTLLSIAVGLDKGANDTRARHAATLLQLAKHKVDRRIPIDKEGLTYTLTPEEYDANFRASLLSIYATDAYNNEDYPTAAIYSATALNLLATISSPSFEQQLQHLNVVLDHANDLLNLHDNDAKQAALIICASHFGPELDHVINTLGDTPRTRYLTARAYKFCHRAHKGPGEVRACIQHLAPLADSHPLFAIPKLAAMYSTDHNSIPADGNWEHDLGSQHAIDILLYHLPNDPAVLPDLIKYARFLKPEMAEHYLVRVLRVAADTKHQAYFDPHDKTFIDLCHKSINWVQQRPLPAPLVMAIAHHVTTPTPKTTQALYDALASASDYFAQDPIPAPRPDEVKDIPFTDADGAPTRNMPLVCLIDYNRRNPDAMRDLNTGEFINRQDAQQQPPPTLITEFFDDPETPEKPTKNLVTEPIE